MTIKVGERVPDATLYEFFEEAAGGCALGPNAFSVADLTAGRLIRGVIDFGLA